MERRRERQGERGKQREGESEGGRKRFEVGDTVVCQVRLYFVILIIMIWKYTL